MGVHPAGEVILQVGLAAQAAQLLQHLQLDLSAEVQGILLEDGVVAGQDNLFERHVVLVALGVVHPSAQHHAAVFLRAVGVAQVFGVEVVDVLDAAVLDVHAAHGRLIAEVDGVHLQVVGVVDDVLQALLLQDGGRLPAHHDASVGRLLWPAAAVAAAVPEVVAGIDGSGLDSAALVLLALAGHGDDDDQQQQGSYDAADELPVPVGNRRRWLYLYLVVEPLHIVLQRGELLFEGCLHLLAVADGRLGVEVVVALQDALYHQGRLLAILFELLPLVLHILLQLVLLGIFSLV